MSDIKSRLKSKIAIGSVALAAAALAGGAYAATQGSSNPRQDYLNDVAKRLNVTPAQLQSALKGAALDQLSAAVKSGKLTQAQADALKQAIQKGNAAPFFFRFGVHPGGALRGHVFFGGRFGAHGSLAAAAKYLGLTDAQLAKQLASGKSLAQIAKAQGKSISGLEQAMTAAIKSRLDKAVANKRITAAQEQKILSELSSRIGDLINRAPPKLGEHARIWGPPHLGHAGFAPGRFMPGPNAPGAPAGAPAGVPPAAAGPFA